MLQLKNTTPFFASMAVFPNEQGIDTLYVAIKATFELGKTLAIAPKQQPIILADEYWGQPGASSVKYASEMHLTKPSTDVVLIGEASAPDQREVTQLDVAVVVAERKKVVRVFGDREWRGGLFGLRMTSPAPFRSMPLVYERAFGGIHDRTAEEKGILYETLNPVGCGFTGKRRRKDINGMPIPNLEDPADLISGHGARPHPAGFGYIAPSWEPRKSFAGTYDEAWQKKRAPYLPQDFNPRFFNMAHPDLVCDGYLRGGEPVEVLNASPRGPFKCYLPVCRLEAVVRLAGKKQAPPLNLETVLIEPNESRLSMLWRAALPCDKQALKVEQIDIGIQNLDLEAKAA